MSSTVHPQRRLLATVATTLATTLVLLILALSPGAYALPPGGASADTEGTAGSVTPRTLRAGEVISFRISGFPAGETVNVKVDDGEFCSEKGVHGACVVHQQKISADGAVKGSFVLPSDLPAGDHWLRFLASAEILDAEGRYVGVKPYTLRGDTDFTVVHGTSGSAPTKQDGASVPNQSPASGVDVPGTRASGDAPSGATEPLAGEPSSGTLRVPVPPGSTAAVAAGSTAEAAAGGVEPAGSTPVAEASEVGQQPAAPFPVVGTAALVAALLVAGMLVLRRRPTR